MIDIMKNKTFSTPNAGRMRIHRFRTPEAAREKARDMKKKFGYTPEVMGIRKPPSRHTTYIVIEPVTLRRIDKL